MSLYLLCFVVLVFSLFLYPKMKTKRQVTRWYQHWEIEKHQRTFNQLYDDVNGFQISRGARDNSIDAPEYVYGEVDFPSFIALISLCNPNENSVFYDLGSGTGKAVLACTMVFKMKKSCGIELFASLHTQALQQRKKLAQLTAYQLTAPQIEFIHTNFLHANLMDATIVFINATALLGSRWHEVCKRLENHTSPHALIISTSKPILSSALTVIKETKVRMSWGIVSAYIHQHSQAIDNIE